MSVSVTLTLRRDIHRGGSVRHWRTPAVGRLGAKPGQQNLLVRVVLRDLEKPLTNQTANALRDRIYRALHQGTEYQWAE